MRVFCSQEVRNYGFTKTRKSRFSQGLAGAMYSITGAESIRAGDAEVSSGVTETCSITGAGGQVNRAGVSHSITGVGGGASQIHSLSRVLKTKRSRHRSQQV